MKHFAFLIQLCCLTIFGNSLSNRFDEFEKTFVGGYESLNIAPLSLSYADNLLHIKSADSVDLEKTFFISMQSKLGQFSFNQLSRSQQQDYLLIKYEIKLNLERLKLEKRFIDLKPSVIADKGLYALPEGKEWYAYFLKKWVTDDVTPDQIFQFGLKEVERVNKKIEGIRLKTGLTKQEFYDHLNDSSFLISDPQLVQQTFENTKDLVYSNLGKLFNPHQIPPLTIKKGNIQALAQTPGYYNENVFYYNLFDKPYNKRQIDWLFLHEGVPGHHYQISIAAALKVSAVQKEFDYLGFSEGWGAYAEELGKSLGLYRSVYDELGKWEWDIVRSVRVPLDVGINYYGWTDEKALTFWKAHVHNQDDIAMREINRLKRWPAQAVTYKYGAARISQLKALLQKQEGRKFNIREFHDRVLNHGSLPLFLVKRNVLKG